MESASKESISNEETESHNCQEKTDLIENNASDNDNSRSKFALKIDVKNSDVDDRNSRNDDETTD